MPFNYSTIHRVSRKSPGKPIVVETAQPKSNSDVIHQALFDQLKQAFNTHAKKQYGYFDPGRDDNPFSGWLRNYFDKKISFPKFNRNIVDQLNHLFNLVPIEEVFEYYLWVISDEEAPLNEVYLFLLKHDENHKISTLLTVEEGLSIHPGKMQYAAKIVPKEWIKTRTKTYLSYLSAKSNPIATVFNKLIGFSEGINRAAQTEEFLNIVELYANNLPDEKEHTYRQNIVDFCLDPDRKGEPLELRALSRHVNEKDPDEFYQFMKNNLEKPTVSLFPDRNELKRYHRFYGRDPDISISFSTAMFGNQIVYNERTDTLTIRSIPKSLKLQLKKYLNKTG